MLWLISHEATLIFPFLSKMLPGKTTKSIRTISTNRHHAQLFTEESSAVVIRRAAVDA